VEGDAAAQIFVALEPHPAETGTKRRLGAVGDCRQHALKRELKVFGRDLGPRLGNAISNVSE